MSSRIDLMSSSWTSNARYLSSPTSES